MAARKTDQVNVSDLETDADRHASVLKALQKLREQEDFPETGVERLEVYFHASGEVTWRAWEPRADEPVGGYIAPSELS